MRVSALRTATPKADRTTPVAQRSSAEGGRRSLPRVRAALLLLGVLAIYLPSPAAQNFDSFLSLPTAIAIVHHHTLHLDGFRTSTVQQNYGLVRTPSGHVVDSFPWTPALFLVPAVVLLDLTHLLGLSDSAQDLVVRNHTDLVQESSASVVAAMTVLVVFAAARQRLRGDQRGELRALVVALVFALGTANWSTASRAMWSHGPAMLALAIAWHVADGIAVAGQPRRRRLILLGLVLAAAATARPASAVVGMILAVWVGLRLGPRSVVAVGGGMGCALLPWFVINRLEFGAWLPGYDSAGRLSLHSHYAEAVAANLVSPSRGLLVASPVVLAAAAAFFPSVRQRLSGQERSLDVALGLSIVAQLLVVSGLGSHWWGGHAYGSRFMSDTLPAIALLGSRAWGIPAVRLRGAWVVVWAALGAWSVFFASQGAIARATVCWNSSPVNVDARPDRVWSIGHAQVFRPLDEISDGVSLRSVVLGHCPARPGARSLGRPQPFRAPGRMRGHETG